VPLRLCVIAQECWCACQRVAHLLLSVLTASLPFTPLAQPSTLATFAMPHKFRNMRDAKKKQEKAATTAASMAAMPVSGQGRKLKKVVQKWIAQQHAQARLLQWHAERNVAFQEAQAKALDSSAHSNGADSGSSADLPAELAGRHPVDRVVDAMICFTECNMMPALNEQLIKGRLAGGLLPSDIQLSTLTMLVESVAAETPADSPCGQPCMPPADHGRRAAAPWCAAAPVGMPDLGLRLVCALDLGCARTVLDVQHLVRIEVAQHRAGEQCQQAQQQHGAAEEKTAAATPPPRAAL